MKRIMNSLLYYNDRDLEFISELEVKEIVKILKQFVNEAEKEFTPCFMDTVFSYKWSIHIWTEHILELSREAINSIIIGNFYSLGSINRTLIECYTYSYCIKFFEDKQLWEDWILNNLYNINAKLNDKLLDDLKNYFSKDKLEKINSYKNRKGENEWLRDVVPVKKSKRISFRDICRLVEINEQGIKNIYKDYQDMCEYVHGTDLSKKVGNFTFYDTYYHLIVIMFDYISKSLINLSENETIKLNLHDIAYEFYILMDKILNNLRDK